MVESKKHTMRISVLVDRSLNIHAFFGRLRRALYGPLVTVWSTFKKCRLVQIALLLAVIPLACVLFVGIYINFNRSNVPDLDGFILFDAPTTGHIYDATAVRLKVEENQLVDVFGEIGFRIDGLKSP